MENLDKKILYISTIALKILEDGEDEKLYEYITKNNKKFLIRTKLPLFDLQKIGYATHPDKENEEIIELNDKDNKLIIKSWRVGKSPHNKPNNPEVSNTSNHYPQSPKPYISNLDSIESLLNEKIDSLKDELINEIISLKKFIENSFETYKQRKPKSHRAFKYLGYVRIRVGINHYKVSSKPEIYKEGDENSWQIITKHKGIIRTINIKTKAPILKVKFIHFYILPDMLQQTEWNIKDEENQITYIL